MECKRKRNTKWRLEFDLNKTAVNLTTNWASIGESIDILSVKSYLWYSNQYNTAVVLAIPRLEKGVSATRKGMADINSTAWLGIFIIHSSVTAMQNGSCDVFYWRYRYWYRPTIDDLCSTWTDIEKNKPSLMIGVDKVLGALHVAVNSSTS